MSVHRLMLAATAAASLAGIAIDVVLAAGAEEGAVFPTAAGRVFNVFCFFTVQSNLLVAVTSVLLLIRPDRSSEVFWALRLGGLVAITVTFIVFHLVLARLVDLDGWRAVSNQLVHTIAPLLAIAAWVVAGPRGHATPRIAWLSLLPAGAWLVFMFVRGELIDYYPYPFVDVADLGYPRALLNAVLVGLLFFALARAAVWLDGRLRQPDCSVGSARRAGLLS